VRFFPRVICWVMPLPLAHDGKFCPTPAEPGLRVNDMDRIKMLAFLSSAAVVLAALLFVADATLEDNGPVIVTSGRIGLPEPWHPDTTETGNAGTQRAPGSILQPLFDTQGLPETETYGIGSEARAARAEVRARRKFKSRPGRYDG